MFSRFIPTRVCARVNGISCKHTGFNLGRRTHDTGDTDGLSSILDTRYWYLLEQARGGTYVFLATLNTRDPVSKWVMTGTAIIMQTAD